MNDGLTQAYELGSDIEMWPGINPERWPMRRAEAATNPLLPLVQFDPDWRSSVTSRFLLFSILICGALAQCSAQSGLDESWTHGLPVLLRIQWGAGASLAHGIQDAAFGLVGHSLVAVGGISKSSPADNATGSIQSHGRFLSAAYRLDLSSETNVWSEIPALRATPRAGMLSAAIGDDLYLWGGYNSNPPYAYRQGFRLTQKNSSFQWYRLPSLPWSLAWPGVAVLGSKIYVFGGADLVNADRLTMYTNTNRTGKLKRLGARLLVFDTSVPLRGWSELPECPGTPRFSPAFAAVDGRLYLVGGVNGDDNAVRDYTTVVDNWRFDPVTLQWQRLAETPISNGNFSSGSIVYANRYILLPGGVQYKHVMTPEGTFKDAYGEAYHHDPRGRLASDVLVYDTMTGKFGVADPLPLNVSTPLAVVDGDRLYLAGGESDGTDSSNPLRVHNPDQLLIGIINTPRGNQ
jgi:hypothetical protein